MVRVGVVGAGNWGRNHVRTLQSLQTAELTAVADPDPSVRDAIARQYPAVATYDAAAEMVSSASVDAVVIATPSPTHAPLARAALAAGKHVLVEKPLATTLADACAMRDEAAAAGRVLMVGHLLLYHGAVRRVKQYLDQGELGRPHYLYCERLNLGVIRPDENALWSLGPHDLSIVRYLMPGEIADVTARGAAYLQPGVQDVVFVNLRYRDGRMANIHLSWLDPHKVRRITVVGDRKMIVFDDMQAQEKIRLYDKGAERVPRAVGYGEHLSVRSGDILIPKVPASEPLREELAHFVDCVARGERPLTDADSGVDIVGLLTAAQASLEAGGTPVPASQEVRT